MAALSPLCLSSSLFSLAPPTSLPPTTLSSSLRLPIRRFQPTLLSVRAAVSAKETPAPKQKQPKGITKPTPISPELQSFVGAPEISRTQALKIVWAYIKEHDLQDPNDKKVIVCDDRLKKLFGKERVGFLEVSKLLNPHFKK
ncbi:SWIB/MDM2 domain superfamily protein [Rhynchospora pubera]|uniref:SWIB/MDM2 domain superfamily protein n=1 Tax=Rhynchospora pubera TaxID=906938 RepID=A0AAV8GJS5_9POAL|nr:SWIB/MDM2 domain superfamily protein [Rhynchospora pubera]